MRRLSIPTTFLLTLIASGCTSQVTREGNPSTSLLRENHSKHPSRNLVASSKPHRGKSLPICPTLRSGRRLTSNPTFRSTLLVQFRP